MRACVLYMYTCAHDNVYVAGVSIAFYCCMMFHQYSLFPTIATLASLLNIHIYVILYMYVISFLLKLLALQSMIDLRRIS